MQYKLSICLFYFKNNQIHDIKNINCTPLKLKPILILLYLTDFNRNRSINVDIILENEVSI